MAQDLADPPVESGLLDLAHVRLGQLLDGDPDTMLDAVIKRLLDPGDAEPLTVCAFSSAL